MRNRHIKKVLAMVCILSCMNISTSYASMVENYNFKNITIEDENQIFTKSINGLQPNTKYFYRTYSLFKDKCFLLDHV